MWCGLRMFLRIVFQGTKTLFNYYFNLFKTLLPLIRQLIVALKVLLLLFGIVFLYLFNYYDRLFNCILLLLCPSIISYQHFIHESIVGSWVGLRVGSVVGLVVGDSGWTLHISCLKNCNIIFVIIIWFDFVHTYNNII